MKDIMNSPGESFDPIAICGFGLRLPGGVRDGESFWRLLVEKRDGHGKIPLDRFNVEGYHHKDSSQRPGTIKMQSGYFLEDVDLQSFDAAFFSMSRREVERLDPQQRLLLEVVYECMESAGEAGWRGSNIGVFVGTFGQDWGDLQGADKMTSGLYNITGQGDFLLSNRVSYEFDLKGPSFTVKTGCSSSFIALHSACEALRSGDCDGAIVGGTNLILAPGMSIAMSEQGIVSPEGRCRTFDAHANGYGRGEAINAVFIKRLSDAVRDGNPIRGLIRGTGSNCDGKSASIASPSSEAHEALIRRTYARSGLRQEMLQTPYVEAHGTGTYVGDPLEASAVARVFSDDSTTYIGSVKPNVGHSEGASGLTSLIKAVLALEKGIIPPNINFTTPNPKIPFGESHLVVPLEPVPWPANRVRRISLNSFGLGGANAHCILDSADSVSGRFSAQSSFPHGDAGSQVNGQANINGHYSNGHADTGQRSKVSRQMMQAIHGSAMGNGQALVHELTNGTKTPNGYHEDHIRPELLVMSAGHIESLEDVVKNIKAYASTASRPMADLSYTLATRREAMRHRAFAVVEPNKVHDLDKTNVAKFKSSTDCTATFVFTGQGAVWPGMGRELLRDFPVFSQTISQLDACLQSLCDPPDWSIHEALLGEYEPDSMYAPILSQPLCTAVQVGLVVLLRSFGAVPDSVIGHSSGEIAAAYAAGALTADEAITLAYYRGQLGKDSTQEGSMAAIGFGAEEVQSFLEPGTVIACENSSASVTISGDSEAVESVMASIKADHPDAFVRKLRVQQAYHSHHMHRYGAAYIEAVRSRIASKRPQIPFFSTAYDRQLPSNAKIDVSYWRYNLESPVLFNSAAKQLLRTMGTENRTVVEIGPHSALAGPLRQIFRDLGGTPPLYIPSMVRSEDCTISLLNTIGSLWSNGHKIDLSALHPDDQPSRMVLPDVPTYPWRHTERFWDESRIAKQWRMRTETPHELLGSPVLEWNDLEPTWRNILRLEDVPWIRGHKVGAEIIFPAAAYVAMVGEALRQQSSGTSRAAYCFRDVRISKALALKEGVPVELMTHLKRSWLTSSLESDWYDFEVSSHEDGSWSKHCWGQARRGGPVTSADIDFTAPLVRDVDPARWYRTLSKVGLKYTDKFHALRSIASSTADYLAAADVPNEIEQIEPRYAMHPATIDLAFQLLTVAAVRGQNRLFKQLAVPTFIEELFIGKCGERVQARAKATSDASGSFGGSVAGKAENGEICFQLRGLRSSPLENTNEQDNNDPHAAVQLDWLPHVDFLEPATTIKPIKDYRELTVKLEKFFLLSAVDVVERLQDVSTQIPHLQKLHSWLRSFIDECSSNGHEMLGDVTNLLRTSDRSQHLADLYASLLETEARPCAEGMERNRENITGIFTGETQPLDILMQDNVLQRMYDFIGFWDYGLFFKSLGHTKPTLRVLEIGAGTGGTTGAVLDGLTSSFGERMYSKYTYTDLSSGFFKAASERFAAHESIEYKVLDISRNPIEQGFEAGEYDVIIAANVLHATPVLVETLKNCRALLKDGGRLLMQELCPSAKWMNFIVGTLPGWWLGEEDNRPLEPYISPEAWDGLLKEAGFDGAGTAIYDNEAPYQINSNIIARASDSRVKSRPSAVTFLYHKDQPCSGSGAGLAAAFTAKDIRVEWKALSEPLPPDQDIISLLEVDDPFLDQISEMDFGHLIHSFSNVQNCCFLWLTHTTQVGCRDPRFAKVLGLGRNLRSELGLSFATIEMDASRKEKDQKMFVELYLRFLDRDESGPIGPDYEYVIKDGVPHVGRFHWFKLGKELKSPCDSEPAEGYARLDIGTRGLLQTLTYKKYARPELEDYDVRVKVHSSGLNFKDVLIAMGVIDNSNLGLEFAGTILEVGDAVVDFKPGDRVMGISRHCIASEVICRDEMCTKVPSGLASEQAATMPVVYATAIYALADIGRLSQGQTVLIHSACGGVGLAAMQLCQHMGAEIYATVGSQEKRNFLVKEFGIPAERIMDSRSSEFVGDIKRLTNGVGVDIVLNSLSGELLHHSWDCVAEFGILLEIGKRDLIGRGKLALAPFEMNRSYAGIDLSHICALKKPLIKSLLRRLTDLIQPNHIKPISPVQAFPATDAAGAFRYMQKGVHIGKVILNMPHDLQDLQACSQAKRLRFRSNAAYLLTGGLGGLGQSTARWMVEHGAKYLVFISRSGRIERNSGFLREIESMGCQVNVVSGAVEDKSVVQEAVAQMTKPIAGVLHLAMVLRDCATSGLTFDDWTEVMKPRVEGLWNLHEVFVNVGVQLDFFVLFSSFCGLVGQWGQANYAASNTFLDAFVQFRHGLGLSASAIDIGAIEDVGYVSQSPAVLDHFKSLHSLTLTEQELLDSVELAIKRSKPSQGFCGAFTNPSIFGIGLRSFKPLDDPSCRLIWKRDVRFSIYRNLEQKAKAVEASQGGGLQSFYSMVDRDASYLLGPAALQMLALEIGKVLFGYLLRAEEDIRVDVKLDDLGIDSLVAIELKNWCRQHLNFETSVMTIMKCTLLELAQTAIDAIKDRRGQCSTSQAELSMAEADARQKWTQVLEMKAP